MLLLPAAGNRLTPRLNNPTVACGLKQTYIFFYSVGIKTHLFFFSRVSFQNFQYCIYEKNAKTYLSTFLKSSFWVMILCSPVRRGVSVKTSSPWARHRVLTMCLPTSGVSAILHIGRLKRKCSRKSRDRREAIHRYSSVLSWNF
jgi:hypothetical protein